MVIREHSRLPRDRRVEQTRCFAPRRERVGSPAVIVVGEVVRLRDTLAATTATALRAWEKARDVA